MSTVTDTVEKYNDSFTFDSYGNNSWSSVKTTLIYRDKQNNKFCVEFDNNSAIDNYGSILYDKEIQQDLQKGTNSENKVFADTSLLYFGLNEKFNNYKKITHPEKPRCVIGALEETRTPDLLIRSQTLYPAELPAHMRLIINRK